MIKRVLMNQKAIISGFKKLPEYRKKLAILKKQMAELHKKIQIVESKISTFEQVTEIFEGVPISEGTYSGYRHVTESPGPFRVAHMWQNANNKRLWGFSTGQSGTGSTGGMGEKVTFHGAGWPRRKEVERVCKVWCAHGRLEMPATPQKKW